MDAARYFLEHGFAIHFNDGFDMTYSKFIHQTMILVFVRKHFFEVLVVGFTNTGRAEFMSLDDDFARATRQTIIRYNKAIIDNHLKRCVLLNTETIEPMKTSEGLLIAADD